MFLQVLDLEEKIESDLKKRIGETKDNIEFMENQIRELYSDIKLNTKILGQLEQELHEFNEIQKSLHKY